MMYPFGLKRTSLVAPHVSGFGGNADLQRPVQRTLTNRWSLSIFEYTPSVDQHDRTAAVAARAQAAGQIGNDQKLEHCSRSN
jgi:hypothetical protein